MRYLFFIMAVTILLSFLTVTLQVKQFHAFRFISKCVASLGFMTMGILALSLQKTLETWHFAVIAALLLGLMGDVFLGTKDLIKEKHKDPLMLSGLLFFLFGHIVFIIVFFILAGDFFYWMISLLVIFPIAIFTLIKLKIINPKNAVVPILAYSLIIGAMAVFSLNYFIVSSGSARGIVVFIGALLFCLSDTLLTFFNFREFKQEKSKYILSYIYLPAYYTAQTLFVLAMVL